jgi:hypothetical protein
MDNEWKCPIRPEDIPAYLNWVAQDMNGEWCGYEDQPFIDDKFPLWTDTLESVQPGGEWLYTGERNANWRNTKQRIPR